MPLQNRLGQLFSAFFPNLGEFSRLGLLRLCLQGIWVLSGLAGRLQQAAPADPYQDRYTRNPGVRSE